MKIQGQYIPYKDGSYNYNDIITEIDDSLLNKENGFVEIGNYFELLVLNKKNDTIQNDVNDIWTFHENCNKCFYSQQSIATKNMTELPILIKQELQKLKFNYQNIFQRAILIDGINFVLELHDESGNFTLLQTVSGKGLRSTKRVYVKVLKINEDGSLTPCRAKLPNILANEIFNILNDYSVNNYDVYNKYVNRINEYNDIQNLANIEYQVNDYLINPQIQEGFFTKNIMLDIDIMIESLNGKSNEELKNLKYYEVDIADFRQWYIEMQDKKVNNKYQIFQAI